MNWLRGALGKKNRAIKGTGLMMQHVDLEVDVIAPF